MPFTTDQLRLRQRLKKLLNDRQNRSYISEKNVICQDRKLRGRIVKLTDSKHLKIKRRATKTKIFNSTLTEEELLLKVNVPSKITVLTEIIKPTEITTEITMQSEVSTDLTLPTDVSMESSGDVTVSNKTVESIETSNRKEPHQYVILYKAIERLWHENLQVFMYHSDSVNFTNFIYPFPELIAVQIKIVVPSKSELDICHIISAKNFIFRKQAFMKMIDTCDDTFAGHIVFILHTPNNDESRPVRRLANKPSIKMKLNYSSNVIQAMQRDNNIGPLDLSIQYSDELEPSDILNKNIMNKLNRLNTVIRRVPEPNKFSRTTVPKNNFVYRSSKRLPLHSRQTGWKCENIYQGREEFVENIVPSDDCRFLNSYQTSNIQSTSLMLPNNDSSFSCTRHMKTDMWLSYASKYETFDREVTLVELDAIPTETLFKPAEDFSLDDYML